MINKNDLRKAISSIAISNAKRNTIYKAFSDLDSISKEEFDLVKSDISKVVESMLTKDTVGKANGVASLDSNGSVPIEQLGNIDTTLFLIVRELPTTDIKTNKIYLFLIKMIKVIIFMLNIFMLRMFGRILVNLKLKLICQNM